MPQRGVRIKIYKFWNYISIFVRGLMATCKVGIILYVIINEERLEIRMRKNNYKLLYARLYNT